MSSFMPTIQERSNSNRQTDEGFAGFPDLMEAEAALLDLAAVFFTMVPGHADGLDAQAEAGNPPAKMDTRPTLRTNTVRSLNRSLPLSSWRIWTGASARRM